MKILVIGSAMHDLFLEYDTPETISLDIDQCEVHYIMLEEGQKIELKKLSSFTGGGATNCSCSFSRLHFSAAPCSKIGNDEYGTFIVDALQEKKIDCSFITRDSREKTGCSHIIPSPTGNSALLVYRGANLMLEKKDIPFADFSEFNQLYITSLSERSSALLPIICKEAQKRGIPIAANPGTSQLTANVKTLITSLEAIEILILNCFESTLLMEQCNNRLSSDKKIRFDKRHPPLLSAPINRGTIRFTLQQYFREIHKRGPSIAVVTNGADGVYVSDGTTIYFHPSLPIEVMSTVGAGDAFGSTFVAQLIKKKSIEDAIRAAIINSASVLEYLDATSGLLDQQELDELVDEIDKNGIKTFPLDE